VSKKDKSSNNPLEANNESSEVINILLPVTFILNLRPGLIMSKTSDDSLLAPWSILNISNFGCEVYIQFYCIVMQSKAVHRLHGIICSERFQENLEQPSHQNYFI